MGKGRKSWLEDEAVLVGGEGGIRGRGEGKRRWRRETERARRRGRGIERMWIWRGIRKGEREWSGSRGGEERIVGRKEESGGEGRRI